MYSNGSRIDNLTFDHHLRSPLSIILGMVHILKKGSLTHTQKEYIDTIAGSTKDLINLADNLSMTVNGNGQSKKEFFKRPKKILLVEDDPTIQFLHKEMLLEMQCHVDTASDPEELLELLNNKYNLILLDIGLPGMSGIQLAKIIRQGVSINKHTSIYALTAYTDHSTKEDCLKSGINRVLIKPITFETLEGILQQL